MEPITIMGTGAMALLFGSRLASAGYAIQLLGTWQEGIQAIQKAGIQVQTDNGFVSYPARAFQVDSFSDPIRLALVVVKSWQTERTAVHLERLLKPEGIALTLQNGLGNAQLLRDVLGQNRAAQGVTTYGATLIGPGIVRPGGEGEITLQQHPALDVLAQSFQNSAMNVRVVADISSLEWSKLAINVAINPLTALLEVPNGKLLDSPHAVKLMGLAAREVASLADHLGVAINFQDPGQAAVDVAGATSENLSSMLQDIHRGAPTEIDALCGEVIQLGCSTAHSTPVNQLLYLLVKSKIELQRN